MAVGRNMGNGTIVLRKIYRIKVQVMRVAAVVIRLNRLKFIFSIYGITISGLRDRVAPYLSRN